MKNIERIRIIAENKSIQLKTSPEKINIDFTSKRPDANRTN